MKGKTFFWENQKEILWKSVCMRKAKQKVEGKKKQREILDRDREWSYEATKDWIGVIVAGLVMSRALSFLLHASFLDRCTWLNWRPWAAGSIYGRMELLEEHVLFHRLRQVGFLLLQMVAELHEKQPLSQLWSVS